VAAVSAYGFRAATAADTALLRAWRASPHWVRWWGPVEADDDFPADVLAEPHLRAWIVLLDETPLAYLQDYDPHGSPGHHFANLPPGARGIDQSIGPAAMLDRGHGTAFVRAFAERLFAAGAPVVATDPHPDNVRAIRAYEKAGFAVTGGPVDTEWGRCLLMEQWRAKP
jgi:aminoglycoside 6'-N-acetyltransferase